MKQSIRKKVRPITALFLAVTLAALSLLGQARENDERFDSYKNMNAETEERVLYVVPNLYRQDASYVHVKVFPLVVNGGIDYVPIDIFSQYSYIDVVYSKLSYGFYISNTKNGTYVAFDLDNGTVSTQDDTHLELHARTFHQTHYVPAKEVCDIIGLTFSVHDDPENGIYAVRISDSRVKYTFDELVAQYSPTKLPQQPQTPDNPITPPVVDPPTTPDTQPPQTPDVPDPYAGIAARRLYLLVFAGSRTEAALDAFAESGRKAAFFFDGGTLTENAAAVRGAVMAGHLTGLSFSPTENGALRDADAILDELDAANETLWLVAKTKTRFIAASRDGASLAQSGFAEKAAERGYVFISPNVAAVSRDGKADSAVQALLTAVSSTDRGRQKTFFVRLDAGAYAAETVRLLKTFTDSHRSFTIETPDAFTAWN